MRGLDGMRILAPADGPFDAGPKIRRRTLIAASETGGRWALGEVIAEPGGRRRRRGEPFSTWASRAHQSGLQRAAATNSSARSWGCSR